MTGRGRPHQATSAKNKTTSKGNKEEKHNGTTKERGLTEREQEKTTRTKEEPSAQSPPKTQGINKLQRTPTNDTPVQGTKAKTKAKPTAPSVEQIKMQPKTTNASLTTLQVKTCGDKTKSQVAFAQQKDTVKAPTKSTKLKTCAGKVDSAVKATADTVKTQPQTPKQSGREDNAAADSILNKTLEKLKIKQNDRSNAAEAVNQIKRNIIKHLKENTLPFKHVEEPLGTGSYYENVKISNPDEFDVMVPIPVDRVNIEPFREDGAFYSVALKRGTSHLMKFQEQDTLSASEMLKEFRDEVKKCVKKCTEWTVTKKKRGCPAVTLTANIQSVTISLDVVLCLMVKSSWPPFTKEGLQIEAWLGTKVKQEYKRKPYYLVPKYEGKGTEERDGVLTKDIWRISFSHIEKAIFKNHGSKKTCCEKDGERCCRKDCLKLLKHLLSLLKEKDSSFDKFCSYHAKTTLLHACCSRTADSDWRASSLSQCFKLIVEDFIGYLEKGELHNFFIPNQNLLSGVDQKRCKSLACCIRREHDKGFPIFK